MTFLSCNFSDIKKKLFQEQIHEILCLKNSYDENRFTFHFGSMNKEEFTSINMHEMKESFWITTSY